MPSREELYLRRAEAQGDKELRRFLSSLSPRQREEYIRGQQEVVYGVPDNNPNNNRIDAPKPAAQPDAQQGPQQAARRPFNMQPYSQSQTMTPALIAQQASSAQARHLGGMIDQVTDAYQDENDSRVAQMREQRRMGHEAEMESMRQEALLQRLAMEQREREKDRILQKQLATGVTTRRLVNGRWEDV
jgi:hypothetical protein